MNTDEPCSWQQAAQDGAQIVEARMRQKPTKADNQIIRNHIQPVDPDILHFLFSGCLTDLISLMSLAENDNVYKTASLSDHIKAYHLLLAILPTELLHHIQATHCHELVCRASHNAFSIRPTSDTDEFLGYGIWPEASFFNHSCQPNVKKERRGRQWTFWTSAEVAEDDELNITYLGGEEMELDVVERRHRLREEWGFECQCLKCLKESHPA